MRAVREDLGRHVSVARGSASSMCVYKHVGRPSRPLRCVLSGGLLFPFHSCLAAGRNAIEECLCRRITPKEKKVEGRDMWERIAEALGPTFPSSACSVRERKSKAGNLVSDGRNFPDIRRFRILVFLAFFL